MTNESDKPSNREKNEKRNWFHSLSRRRKSSTSTASNSISQNLPNRDQSASTTANAAATTSTRTSNQDSLTEDGNPTSGKERRLKDERKNVFQRFKKRIGVHFSMRQKKSSSTETTSSSSPVQHAEDGVVCYPRDLSPMPMINIDPPEMVSFTHHYRKFVAKKWLENASRPNRVMYTACSEMLGQVWYWGEISRRDAQRQLTDKPIGSFLVRDSETGGSSTCWYTLSFRILNCTLHYRLEHRANYWHFEELQYESIVEMIEDILHRCTKDHFVCFVRGPNELQPPLAVVLKYPVSRYIKIMKLQDLCRRVIQRHIAVDEIPELQIPVKLQEYLSETRELVFQSS